MAEHCRRPLRTGDFFPDLIGQDSQGKAWHSAQLAGRPFALWLCADAPTHQRCAAAMASCNKRFLFGISSEVLTFAGPQASLPMTTALMEPERARPLFFSEGTGDPVLCLLRADGKIAWMGPLSVTKGDGDGPALHSLRLIARGMSRAESGPGLPPILAVEQALPVGLCADLIQYFHDSTHKVQGRVGLSTPQLDLGRKRRSHVNLDRDMAMAVDDALVYTMLPMIERCLDLRVTHRVAYKVALYDAGDAGFFFAHRDNSDPGTRYRRFALSLALNDDWQGGGLCFPEFGSQCHRIGAGNALIFPASLLHQVLPVESGQRIVLLSFLYDEAGARDRRAHMADPALLDGVYQDAIDPDLLAEYNRYYAPSSRFAPQYTLLEAKPTIDSA